MRSITARATAAADDRRGRARAGLTGGVAFFAAGGAFAAGGLAAGADLSARRLLGERFLAFGLDAAAGLATRLAAGLAACSTPCGGRPFAARGLGGLRGGCLLARRLRGLGALGGLGFLARLLCRLLGELCELARFLELRLGRAYPLSRLVGVFPAFRASALSRVTVEIFATVRSGLLQGHRA